MKIKYHQQHSNQRRLSRALLAIFLVAGLFGALYGGGFLTRMMQSFYMYSKTFVHTTQSFTQTALTSLTPKAELIRNNQTLRSTVQDLTVATLYNQTLEQENTNLRKLLGAPSVYDTKRGALARVIEYQDIPYGTLLVKNESGNPVRKGAIVHFGNWALGKVTKIHNDSILIKLFTASNEAYDVLVGDTTAVFVGSSNGTGTIRISRAESILLNTPVALPSAGGFILGSIMHIERSDEAAMQTLLVRTPFNISTLRFVTISDL